MSSVAQYLTDVYDLAARAQAITTVRRYRRDAVVASHLGDRVTASLARQEARIIASRYNL